MVNGPSYNPGDVSTPRVPQPPNTGNWTWKWDPVTITWVRDYSGNSGIGFDTTLGPGPSTVNAQSAFPEMLKKALTTPMWWPIIGGTVWLLMMKGGHGAPKH